MIARIRTAKPLQRRIGNLVVSVHHWGIELRAFRKHSRKRVTWEQIASLADDSEPILLQEEKARGQRALVELGVKEDGER